MAQAVRRCESLRLPPADWLLYSIQPVLRDEIYRQLFDILSLSGEKQSDTYRHLDSQTRGDILAILRETKSDLPDNWK